MEKHAVKITATYLLIGALYIAFSDLLVENLISDVGTLIKVQILKGWVYVLVTGILIYFLVRNGIKEIRKVSQERTIIEEKFLQAQKMESLGLMTGKIVHDLRNHMTVIQGNIELLEPDYHDESSRNFSNELLGEIQSSINNTQSLLKNILSFGKNVRSSPQKINLNVFIIHHLELLRPIIHPSIEFETLFLNKRKMIYNKPTDVSQSLNNLVFNSRDAIKEKFGSNFSNPADLNEKPKITIKVEDIELIEFRKRKEEEKIEKNYIVVRVKDNGIGMDKTTQSRIFQPFFTTKGKEEGTGLGLNAVKSIVEGIGGEIIVKSEKGIGSEFSLFWPVDNGE